MAPATRRPAACAAAAIAAAAAACTDLPTPAELARPQILAVRADPPAIPAGDRAALSILLAGPDGPISGVEVDWSLAEPTADQPAIGRIERDAGAVWYVAPAEVDGVALAAVEATAYPDDSPPLVAVKAIAVGVPQPTANPDIVELSADGAAIGDDADGAGALAAVPGQIVDLDVVVDPPPGDDSQVAWYASVGEFDRYRRAPTTWTAPEEPADGDLFVVYRDGRGGVAWRHAAIAVHE